MSLFNLSSLSTTTSSSNNNTNDSPQSNEQLPTSPSLSYDQFRSKLISQYSKSGVLKNLKTQLRTQILLDIKGKARDVQRDNYLRQEQHLGKENQFRTEKENWAFLQVSHNSKLSSDSLKQQLFFSIILSFLKHRNLNYTISVLISEADLSDHLLHSNALEMLCEMFHREELPFKKGKSASRRFTAKNAAAGKVDALEALYELSDQMLTVNSVTQGIQTEDMSKSQHSIDHKLRMLDEQFLHSRQQDQHVSAQSLEERMIEFQRKCELRARKEIDEKMRFYEETSLSAMRLEESAKYREKLGAIKEKLEQEHSQKLKKLSEREQETRELLRKKEQDFEKASHEHRQSMMKEVAKLQSKQNAMRRMELEVERARQEVEDKSRRIDVLHSQTSIDMKTELDVLKQQLESKYEQHMQELQVQRQMFEKEKIQVQSEKQAIDNTYRSHGDIMMIKETAEQQRQTIESLKSQLGETRLENQHLKTVCDELRHENNQFKYAASSGSSSGNVGGIPSTVHASLDQRYNNLLQERQDLEDVNKVHVSKIQDLLKRNEILEKETTQLSHALDMERHTKNTRFEERSKQLQEENMREKNNIRQLTYKWNTERALLRDQVEKLESTNESLQRELEEERLNTRKFSLDLSNETALLKQTQQALENALSSDTANEMQTQADHRERLVKELQREVEQVKLEKQQTIRDMTAKIDEEARHAANLKEALAQNQKMLEKAQSSFSNATLSQEERDKQKRVEVQILEDKLQSQITQLNNEKKRLENLVQQKEDQIAQLQQQVDEERQKYSEVETKRRTLEDELMTTRRQLTDTQHDQQSHERISREYEQRIQDVQRQADQRLKSQHLEIEMRFSSRVRALNPNHADALRAAIGANTAEMLQLLGNPEQLEDAVRTQERNLGIVTQRAPVLQENVARVTNPPLVTEQTRQVSPRQEAISQPLEVEKAPHAVVETVQQEEPSARQSTTTVKETSEKTMVPSQDSSQVDTTEDVRVTRTVESAQEEPAEKIGSRETSPVKEEESPQKDEVTGVKKYIEQAKKERQEERENAPESDDDFHMTGFEEDNGLDDLGLERSDDEDLAGILEQSDDDFF